MTFDAGQDQLALQLLGPPQIRYQGASLKIVRRQARALLYRIAAEPAAVPRERLAFLFWPDEPDAKARRNLSRLLSYLRQELPHPDCVLLNRRAIRLNLDQVWSDCVVLEEAQESGEPATLQKSADLYRGRFLEGFSGQGIPEFARWREQRAAQLESVYLGVLRRLITVLSERNEIKAAIRYARRYLAVDNLAEEIHRRLIALHGREGDRTSATRQFEQCNLLLERELGVAPLPETRDAYEMALRDSAGPLPTRVRPQSWSVLPSLELPLIGRDEVLHSLQNAATRLASGGLILITGQAGVGKTRLLQTFAHGSERMPLTGNSHRGGRTISYQPLVQALRQTLDTPHRWRHIHHIWLAEMGRLLPELPHIFPDLPRPLEVAPREAQGRLLEAVTRSLFGLAEERPILLCLDDLHWADAATLRWLIEVRGRFPDSRLLVVATARLAEVQAIADVKRAFRRVNRLAHISLGGLTPAAIGRVLEGVELGLSEETRDAFAGRLHGATGGNTFFVLETVRTLMESDRLYTPADELPLAPTVEDAIRSRVETLTPVSQQLLQTAAVLSPDLAPGLLRRTAGRTDLEVADALDELVARQLLQEEDNAHAFDHDLVRMVVYRGLTPWRRRILHRRAAEALSRKHGEPALKELATIAQHFDAAGANVEAIQAYREAAASAAAVYAYDAAAGHLRRAISLLPDTESARDQAVGLYQTLGQNLAYVARHDEARVAYGQGLNHCAGDDWLTIARLHERIAGTYLSQLYYEKARRRLEQALAALEEARAEPAREWHHLWLQIKLRFIYLHFCLYEIEVCLALIEEITPVVERVGTSAQKSRLAHDRISVALLRERYRPSAATIALARRHDERVRKSQNLRAAAMAGFNLGYCLLFSENLTAAESPLLESLARAEEVAYRHHEARCLAFLSALYRLRGERARAEAFARRAVEAGREVGSRHYQAHAQATLAWLDFHDGEIEAARNRAQEATANFLDTRVPFAYLALIILLAIRQRDCQTEKAVEAAAAMLQPQQRRLPDPLTDALVQAVARWKAGDKERARNDVSSAVDVAQEHGYL